MTPGSEFRRSLSAPALAEAVAGETISVKVSTATRGGSNWKSLPSGGPIVNESLPHPLGDGGPVGRNHSWYRALLSSP